MKNNPIIGFNEYFTYKNGERHIVDVSNKNLDMIAVFTAESGVCSCCGAEPMKKLHDKQTGSGIVTGKQIGRAHV